MITLLIVIQVIVSFVLILVILLQAGKGGGLGGAFGGSSQAVFGGRGAQTFLGKVTSVAAAVFMLTSLSLSYLSTRSTSVVRAEPSLPTAPAPVAPAPVAPAAPSSSAPQSVPPAAPAPAPGR